MSRRTFIATLACLAAGPLAASDPADEKNFWSTLKTGGRVILLRHAQTDPGIGDPANFKLESCGTQRNLSAKGRADAKRISQAFASQNIPVREVLSSRWCRCIDTAQLAFGRVKPAAMLDSMFDDSARARRQMADAVLAFAVGHTGPGNLVLVTHAQNIQALTGISPAPGELIVVALASSDKFKVKGRLSVPGGY